jgi:HK97 family phage prohead protease
MVQYQYKAGNSGASFKDADVSKGIVTGYFASFGNKDSDGDIIVKGAFEKSIHENGPQSLKPRIKHLLNHDVTKPLGKLLLLQEDAKGLYYESQVGTHSLGKDFVKMVESGLITEHSIGFKAMKEDKKSDANYMIEIKLWEGSGLTAWGANSETPMTGMKSLEKAHAASNRIEMITKALRDGTYTDETFDLLEIELKQLQQLYINLTTTTEPELSTLPETKELMDGLQTFNNNLKAENGKERVAGAA